MVNKVNIYIAPDQKGVTANLGINFHTFQQKQNAVLDHPLEPSCTDTCNEWSQQMFSLRNQNKKYLRIILTTLPNLKH